MNTNSVTSHIPPLTSRLGFSAPKNIDCRCGAIFLGKSIAGLVEEYRAVDKLAQEHNTAERAEIRGTFIHQQGFHSRGLDGR